eukprot:1038351-Alexandrium_andersonii.AAC.1
MCIRDRGAAEALWQARRRMGLGNLRGVRDAGLDGKIEATLLEYLRDVEAKGAAARSTGPRGRVEAKPHQSAM